MGSGCSHTVSRVAVVAVAITSPNRFHVLQMSRPVSAVTRVLAPLLLQEWRVRTVLEAQRVWEQAVWFAMQSNSTCAGSSAPRPPLLLLYPFTRPIHFATLSTGWRALPGGVCGAQQAGAGAHDAGRAAPPACAGPADGGRAVAGGCWAAGCWAAGCCSLSLLLLWLVLSLAAAPLLVAGCGLCGTAAACLLDYCRLLGACICG